ncbi:MAG: PAS domain-containing sensor histidine kinase, partial [Aquabacterium sp.]
MPAPSPASPLPSMPSGAYGNGLRRFFRRWWREQSPARQDRYATLGPLVSVMLFLAAIVAAFWYLRNEEIERERESVKRDTEVVQQQIRMRLIENQEQLVRIARDVVTRDADASKFLEQASGFVQTRPEIVSLSWTQADHSIKASQLSPNFEIDTLRGLDMAITPDAPASTPNNRALPSGLPEFTQTFEAAKEQRQPVYSRPHVNALDTPVVQVHVPLIDRRGFAGTLVAEYSVEALLRYLVPSEVSGRHVMSLTDYNGRLLASTIVGRESANTQITHEVIITPVGNGLILRGEGSR